MEHEGSLPHSQASATVPILDQPKPVHIPTSWRSILILSTHLCLGLPSCLFPSGFPTKTLYAPSPHPYAPHAQPISFFSILSPAQYWVKSTDNLAPHTHTLRRGTVKYLKCPNLWGFRMRSVPWFVPAVCTDNVWHSVNAAKHLMEWQ